jgi:hypothetical protein
VDVPSRRSARSRSGCCCCSSLLFLFCVSFFLLSTVSFQLSPTTFLFLPTRVAANLSASMHTKRAPPNCLPGAASLLFMSWMRPGGRNQTARRTDDDGRTGFWVPPHDARAGGMMQGGALLCAPKKSFFLSDRATQV